MCDFLIQNQDHWMDFLTPVQIEAFRQKGFQKWERKYNSRNRRYDIIECKPDGFYKDHQHGGGKFLIIHVPGLSVEEAKRFSGPVTEFSPYELTSDGMPLKILRLKNRCRINILILSPSLKAKLQKNYVCTITSLGLFESLIENKVSI